MRKIHKLTSLLLALTMSLTLCVPASAKQEIKQYHSEPASLGLTDNLQERGTSLYKDGDASGWGATWLRDQDGETLSAGSLGAEARLFNKDGELISSTGMRYNTKPASFVRAVTPAVSGAYCSYGRLRSACHVGREEYDVSSDTRVTADGSLDFSYELERFQYPENLLSAIKEHEDGYPRNALGETYGSALFYGYGWGYGFSPVLVAAVGTGGVHGYVREADLNPYLETRMDAVEYMVKLEQNRVLPLYDKDGKVIGTFVLDGSFTSGTTEKELNAVKAATAKTVASTAEKVTIPTEKAALDKLAKRSEANCPYGRTEKGETYGNATQFGSVGYEPVWVTVVATDTKKEGLVRAKEFYYTSDDDLPVYDLKGNEIGVFSIG